MAFYIGTHERHPGRVLVSGRSVSDVKWQIPDGGRIFQANGSLYAATSFGQIKAAAPVGVWYMLDMYGIAILAIPIARIHWRGCGGRSGSSVILRSRYGDQMTRVDISDDEPDILESLLSERCLYPSSELVDREGASMVMDPRRCSDWKSKLFQDEVSP